MKISYEVLCFLKVFCLNLNHYLSPKFSKWRVRKQAAILKSHSSRRDQYPKINKILSGFFKKVSCLNKGKSTIES